jgi:hypothetical protein
MSEKKLAYDFWNTPEGIRSQKIFDMRDRIRRLEANNEELLEALEAAQRFIQNGIKYGYINMPDNNCGDSALDVRILLDTKDGSDIGKR